MFQWSDEHQMIRDAVKRFVDDEIRPHVDELEHGDLPPYDILRKLFATFGMDAMARESFKKGIERERAIAAGEEVPEKTSGGDGGGMSLIPIIELCRVCPGMVTAMGVSMGLTSAAIGGPSRRRTLRTPKHIGSHSPARHSPRCATSCRPKALT